MEEALGSTPLHHRNKNKTWEMSMSKIELKPQTQQLPLSTIIIFPSTS
jgi:hypothetical protein